MGAKDLASLKSIGIDHVVGRVRIDYRDPLTGKVKERIAGKNHIFEDSFKTANWAYVLENTVNETLFLTDTPTPPDDNFPYLLGNIIGWGRLGADGNGIRQGLSVGSETELCAPILNPSGSSDIGRRWRHTYEFGASQVPEEVRTVGFTNQYATSAINPDSISNTAQSITLRSLRARRNVTSTPRVWKGEWGVRVSDATNRIVEKWNASSGESKNMDIVSFVPFTSSDIMSVGISSDSDKAWVLVSSGTASRRILYEFSDDTFSTLLTTYNLTAFTSSYSPHRGIFVVSGEDIIFFSWNSTAVSGVHKVNYKENSSATKLVINSCPLNTSSDYYTNVSTAVPGLSFIIKNNKLFIFGVNQSSVISNPTPSTRYRFPIIDLSDLSQIGSIGLLWASNSSQYATGLGGGTDPTLGGRTFILTDVSNSSMTNMKQALTAYVIPEDAPKRPSGAAMTVSYQIDVMYE